jgi:hypothetical protein
MPATAQIELLSAQKVADEATMQISPNGIRYAVYGDTQVSQAELERVIHAVPSAVTAALADHKYYFVPLTIGETEETLVAPGYTLDLSDRAVCHRNFEDGKSRCIFISTRLMQDRFALAFEFFINLGHHFVDAAGVPQSFSDLVWSQAIANIRGETSQDAWESRRRATEKIVPQESRGELKRPADRKQTDSLRNRSDSDPASEPPIIDERAKTSFFESAFADAIAIYMLSLTLDFDYFDLREREYPLLAAPALAERLRHVAMLFPPNAGYEFQISYRRRS